MTFLSPPNKRYFAAYAGSECGGAWNNPIGLVPLSNGTHVIEYMGTGYGSTRFALITEQANATWKLKSFKIEEKRFTPKTSCGQHIPIDKDYNSNTTPLFTASTASTTVSVPATPTPKRVVITGSIAAGAAPAQFGASLSFSTTVGKVYTIYLENVSLETTNLAPSYQNYTGYAVVNHPADAGDAGKMLANGSLGYTSCYKGYAITFVARATTTWLVLGGMVAAQDAGQAASVSVLLQKLRIVGSQPIRRTVQLLADKRYRYAFNGQEKDDEIGKGDYNFGDRIYNSLLGRPFTLDRLKDKFPGESNYSWAGNSPIAMVDNEGKNKMFYVFFLEEKKNQFLTKAQKNDIVAKIQQLAIKNGMGDVIVKGYNTNQRQNVNIFDNTDKALYYSSSKLLSKNGLTVTGTGNSGYGNNIEGAVNVQSYQDPNISGYQTPDPNKQSSYNKAKGNYSTNTDVMGINAILGFHEIGHNLRDQACEGGNEVGGHYGEQANVLAPGNAAQAGNNPNSSKFSTDIEPFPFEMNSGFLNFRNSDKTAIQDFMYDGTANNNLPNYLNFLGNQSITKPPLLPVQVPYNNIQTTTPYLAPQDNAGSKLKGTTPTN